MHDLPCRYNLMLTLLPIVNTIINDNMGFCCTKINIVGEIFQLATLEAKGPMDEQCSTNLLVEPQQLICTHHSTAYI